jgi:hypothetical protein
MPNFLGKTITSAEEAKIVAAYTTDNPEEADPTLAEIEARTFNQIQNRVQKHEDNVAAQALTKSTFDITS